MREVAAVKDVEVSKLHRYRLQLIDELNSSDERE